MEAHNSSKNVPAKGTVAMKSNVPAKILGLFSELAQQDADKRVKTAMLLVRQIISSEKNQSAGGALGPAASYSLSRLVRGLASSRAGAREGFFTGLSLLLRRLPAVSTGALLDAADTQLADVRGDPRRATEHRIGRLLAAGAAVRAGRRSELPRLMTALLSGWQHRAYMPPMVATFVAELVLRVTEEEFVGAVWPALKPLIAAGWEGCIPERLWLLVVCREQFPEVVDSKFLKEHWGSKKIMSPKNYEGIMQMIKVSAGSLPMIHPLVTALAGLAVTRPAPELAAFRTAVLEPLLADRADPALLVMAAVQLMVPDLTTPELVESLLSPAVIGALVALLPKRDQRTEQAARGLGSALVSRVLAPESTAELQLAVIGRLVTPPGSINFDHMTGTKILAQMLNGLKAEALEPFSNMVLSVFEGTQSDRNLTPRGRAAACDLLCRLVQHPSAPGRTPLKEKLLERLFTAGVLRDDTVTDELAATARRAFFRALEHPVRRLSELTELLRALAERQQALLSSGDAELREPLSPEARAAWDAAGAALRRLKPGAGPDTDVFIILLGHLSQQLFGAECVAAVDALQELHGCLERQQQRRQRAAEEPAWSEVVVDLLLSLLALNVHLLRSVVRSVFTLLAPMLSPEAVLYAFQSLNPEFKMNGAPAEGADGLDSAEEEGSADEEEDGSEEEEEESGEEEEEEWEDVSEDGSDGEEEKPDDDALENVRNQVKAALGGDLDDDAVSVDMDDVPEEHLARVDAALAAAFRAQRKDKRMRRGDKPTDEELAMMHFRIRVLDLVDVYVRVCRRSAPALGLLPPLVSLLSSCASDGRQAALVGRLRACLSRLTASGGGRLPDGHGVTQPMLAELLREVLTSGARLPAFSLELGSLLSAAVRLLVRTSAAIEGDRTAVTDVLTDALKSFFTDRECVYPARMFAQLLALPGWSHGWTLVTPLLDAALSADVRLYRRTQALQLATAAFRSNALTSAAPRAELEAAAARVEQGVQQLVSEVSTSDSVRTKFLSSALEALLAARQKLGAAGRTAIPLDASLTQLAQRVTLNRHVRRLVNQLTQLAKRSESGNNAATPSKKKKRPAAPAEPAESEEPHQSAKRPGRRSKAAVAVSEAKETNGSDDSGVAEEADSDVEPPPKKKMKNRSRSAARVTA